VGHAIFLEYCRLGLETDAFQGPWVNSRYQDYKGGGGDGWRVNPCGGADVRGHRHDQTALSVCAWRYGVELTNPPEFIAYTPGETDKTILSVNGAY
jgi:hypothetical protein